MMLSFLSSSVIELIQLSNTSSNITCVEINSNLMFDSIESNPFLLLPAILFCISITLVGYTGMEFFIAKVLLKLKDLSYAFRLDL